MAWSLVEDFFAASLTLLVKLAKMSFPKKQFIVQSLCKFEY